MGGRGRPAHPPLSGLPGTPTPTRVQARQWPVVVVVVVASGGDGSGLWWWCGLWWWWHARLLVGWPRWWRGGLRLWRGWSVGAPGILDRGV